MKAVICEFCKTVIPEDDQVSMVYGIHIYAADDDGFQAETRKEKALLLEVDHACMDCTAKVKAAIEFIRKGAKKK